MTNEGAKEIPKVNNKAIVSFVLGLFSIFISILMAFGFVTGIIGLTVGLLGLREIKLLHQGGKMFAIVGILSCIVGSILPVLFMI